MLRHPWHILNSDPKLQGFGSLLEVINFAKDRVNSSNHDITLKGAGREYINDLTTRKRSENYLKQVFNRLNKLYSYVGEDFLVKDFTKEMIRAWIRGQGKDLSPFTGNEVTNTTRTNELTFLKGFFNFCEGQDYIEVAPTTGVKSYGKNQKEIVALTITEASELLEWAKAYSDEAYAYFALSLFAGLRPEELRPQDGQEQVMWEDFTFRTKGASTLEVSYLVGKVSTRRVVELPENLVSILLPMSILYKGPVIASSYAKWRGIKDYIRAKAGYRVYGQHFNHIDPELAKVSSDTNRKEYVRDVLRHSAITYKLELVKNKDAVALWAGNSPAIIDSHYRALVKGTDELDPTAYANAYFDLK